MKMNTPGALRLPSRIVPVQAWLLACALIFSTTLAAQQDGSLDMAFSPGTSANGNVFATVIQPDGKILIGGAFTLYDGTSRGSIARINSDGSLDTTFDPGSGFNSDIETIELQADGKILVGGSFTSFDGVSRHRIARLNSDGSLDTTFDAGLITGLSGVNVEDIVVQPDGRILLAGIWDYVDSTLCPCIARLHADGSFDTSFDPGAGPTTSATAGNQGNVFAIGLQADGKVVVGGRFASFDGVARNNIVRLNSNGSVDSTFDPDVQGNFFPPPAVLALALEPNGRILLGGIFNAVGGASKSNIARINGDGSLDAGFSGATNSFVYGIAPQLDSRVVLAGTFTVVNGASCGRVARLNADGSLDSSFNLTGADSSIFALDYTASGGGQLVIAGHFGTVDGIACSKIAKLTNSGGTQAITSTPVTGVELNGSYNYAIVAVGSPAPTISVNDSDAGWPSWLSFNSSNNTLSGTAPSAPETTITIVVEADNGLAIHNQQFQIVVGVSPQITSSAPSSATVGQLYTYTITASGNPTPSISVSGNPSWLTLTGNVLSGTPAASDAVLTGAITVTATNAVSSDDEQFQIDVAGAPIITSSPPTDAQTGTAYSFFATSIGRPAPTFSLSGNPPWLSVDSNTGELSGTPALSDAGTSNIITVTATNTHGSDSQQFQIEVITVPVVTSIAPTTATVGVPYSYTITATGWPTPTFVFLGGIPSWLSFTGDTLSGTPSASDLGATGTLTIRAENSVGQVLDQFNIQVIDPPVFTSTPVTAATAGSAYTYTLTASGTPTPTLSATSIPSWLNFNASTGELSGTPGSGDIGTAGNDVVIEANNASGTDTQSFTITVDGVPPTITSTPVLFATVGMAYTYTVLASGIPAPALSAGVLPGWLSFDPNTGELSGIPGNGDLGLSTTINITASNGWMPDDVQSFQIQVNGTSPVIVSAPPPRATIGSLYTYTIVATGSPPPAFSIAGAPAWLSLSGDVLSGIPMTSDAGLTGSITITASNGNAPDAVQNFTIDVSHSNSGGGGDDDGGGCVAGRGQLLPFALLLGILSFALWRRRTRCSTPV